MCVCVWWWGGEIRDLGAAVFRVWVWVWVDARVCVAGGGISPPVPSAADTMHACMTLTQTPPPPPPPQHTHTHDAARTHCLPGDEDPCGDAAHAVHPPAREARGGPKVGLGCFYFGSREDGNGVLLQHIYIHTSVFFCKIFLVGHKNHVAHIYIHIHTSIFFYW